jgi:Zn-dependent protease
MATEPRQDRSPSRNASSHWSFSIGHVAGIDVRVHLSFFLIVALFAVASTQPGGEGLVAGLGWLVVLFACVVVHELAHCVVGRSRGAQVHEIVLLPIGGVSRMERMPELPDDELAMAIAGPAASVALGVAAGMVALALGVPLLPVSFVTGSFVVRLFWVNLVIAGFNLLPAFPLDGGRVLRALLARRCSEARATHLAAVTGRSFGLALVAVGLVVNLWFAILGAFVYFGAQLEEAATIQHLRLRGLHVRDLMLDDPVVVAPFAAVGAAAAGTPVVGPDDEIEDDLLVIAAAPRHAVAVVDHMQVVGVLRLEDVQRWVHAGDGGDGS